MENTHTHTQERELASACFVKALGVATISRFNEAIIMNENEKNRDFPGGPVVKTLHFHCRGKGSIPGWGTKIPHATPHGQKKERKKKLGKEYKNMINISPHKIYKWPINT